jgi:hypothetical protein
MLNHLCLHQGPIHPINSVRVFLILVVVVVFFVYYARVRTHITPFERLYVEGAGLACHALHTCNHQLLGCWCLRHYNIFFLWFGHGYIIRYHRCFPPWFTTSPLIPSYSICYPCRGSTCFARPLNLVGCRSIQHSSMACIFVFPFLVFVIFRHGVVRKAIKRRAPIYISTWQGTRKHYKGSKQLEHMHWLFKDL